MINSLKLILLTALVFFGLHAHAFQTITEDNKYTLAADQTLDDEHLISAFEMQIDGNVTDDLFLHATGTAALAGTFEHNVWCLADHVELTGLVKHNLRIAGATLLVNGTVDGNVLALGNVLSADSNINLGSGARTKGNFSAMGSSVVLAGTINGNAHITASKSITITGIILGDATFTAPEIILHRNAHIHGNLTYTAAKEVVPTLEQVDGTVTRQAPQPAPVFNATQLKLRLVLFLMALLTSLMVVALFPSTIGTAAQIARNSPVRCLFSGIVGLLVLPLLGAVGLRSGIGMPLGLLAFGAWAFLGYTSQIIAALLIGRLVLRRTPHTMVPIIGTMTLGLALIYIITLLPALSFSIWSIVITLGSGALIQTFRLRRQMILHVQTHPLTETNPENISKEEQP